MLLQIDWSFPQDWVIVAAPWQWALVILVGAAAAWWLYGRGSRIQKNTTGGGMTIVGRFFLGLLRWTVISTLAFLLLEPLIRLTESEREDPTVIFLMDASRSIVNRSGAVADASSELKTQMTALNDAFQSKSLSTEWYGFDRTLAPLNEEGSFASMAWEGEQTNLDIALRDLSNQVENRNIAAVILLSDGLINRGANPEFSAQWPDAPIYSIGLGDTTQLTDRWIERINHNQVAYLGNSFPVECIVQSQGMQGESADIRIFQGSELLFSETWTSKQTNEIKRFECTLPARGLGTTKYRVETTLGANEFEPKNNVRNFYVDILENKRLITCIGKSPHPDLGAMRMALAGLESYEVQTIHLNQVNDPNEVLDRVEASDVIIAHNLIGERWGGKNWVQIIAMLGKPTWWWVNSPTGFRYVQQANDLGVSMTEESGLDQMHQARFNADFGLIEFDADGLEDAIRSWPPLQSPLERLQWSPAWNPILFKQLGSIQTQEPFWALRSEASGERAILAVGEGLWGWRMRNYVQNGDNKYFDELIQRQVQFLGTESGRNRLMVRTEPRLQTDQLVQFRAEVYDATWSPTRQAVANVSLINDQGEQYTQPMIHDGQRYSASFGRMPAGEYRWEAQVSLDQEQFIEKGQIIIEDEQIELSVLPADHGLLTRIAEKNGGEFLGVWSENASEEFATRVTNNGIPPVVIHESNTLNDGISWKLLWPLLLLLLTAEWVIRRRTLGY